MNRREQELLDKQLHAVHLAPRGDGVLMLAILAVFSPVSRSAVSCSLTRRSRVRCASRRTLCRKSCSNNSGKVRSTAPVIRDVN